MAEKKEFTLEDILEEQRSLREEGTASSPSEKAAAPEEFPKEAPAPRRPAMEDTADLNAFATGNFQVPPEAAGE